MNLKASQRHRVNRVINFVQTGLCGAIDLDAMADVACLSKHHFIRVFDAHLGQTPLRYLTRVRLERAARQLIFLPETAVGTIATGCGFATHHSFTRAFSRHFGYSPQDFRVRDINQNLGMPVADHAENYADMEVRDEYRGARRIAYIRHFGPYRRDCGGIREAGDVLRDWAESRGLDSRLPLVGLCPDNRRITPASHCAYDIGIPVGVDIIEDDLVSVLTIPAGRYAVGSARCHNDQLLYAWDWLCSGWRQARGAPYQQRWNYEVFRYSGDGRLDPRQGVDLCLRLTD